MKRFLMLAIMFTISSCDKVEPQKGFKRTFVIMDFCKNDIVRYFDQPQIKNVGIKFDFLEHNRKLKGAENIVGTGFVSGVNLDFRDLDSFINGALSECYPNARVDISLDDKLVKDLFSKIQAPGELIGPNILIRLDENRLMIYSKY